MHQRQRRLDNLKRGKLLAAAKNIFDSRNLTS